ncbi:phosphonoacetate hydrolase [Yoonia vestfoldensis]|uniref:phosphonoacetate hydrolase n=1 Tax=Yoonia vestfoldensis TaxID=245188 RepID=UPI0003A8F82A|nr:phosphonoacetate hydrolase [Yoonia vestfoldensis]
MTQKRTMTINSRSYDWPTRPAVVICLDGCEPAYIEAALASGAMPALAGMLANGGTQTQARGAMPSFTNPNNLSIATGVPSSMHGICGNFFLDPETGEEVMMNSIRFLRAPTIFAGFYDAGARVAVLTAKDQLRELLGAGLDCASDRAICFSAERAGATTRSLNGLEDAAAWLGRPEPQVYSGDLSLFVLYAGVRLLAEWQPELMYLSTSDYIQHKHAPGSTEANAFMAGVDGALGGLLAGGARVVLTADHGMKPKHHADGTPNVVYLDQVLAAIPAATGARVILPITDPYVAHHGALGAFATIYLPTGIDPTPVIEVLRQVPGIDEVLDRKAACLAYALPPERVGDIVVTSTACTALGTAPDKHDLTGLDAPLRSHGGRDEQLVPFIVNGPLGVATEDLRNFDAWQCATKVFT